MEQRYQKGDKVRVVHIGSPWWEFENGEQQIYDRCPEAIGQVGEVEDSKETQGRMGYILKWPEGTKLHVAWWHEYQLEPEGINTPREQQRHYPDYRESNTGKELRKMAEKAENVIMWGNKKGYQNGQ